MNSDGDLVQACPKCDRTSLVINSSSSTHEYADDKDHYRCPFCNWSGGKDDVTEREREANAPGVNGLAADLFDADPDDV